MKPTIEQALQQGVAAHKEGKLQDAERLYRAILQSQPAHPDANHNLGVLAVSVNKIDAALPLFKTALEGNPKIERFWLSYIDALIKEQQLDNAKQVIEQAKKQGVALENLNALEEKLVTMSEAENIDGASPSQELLSNLVEHYDNGRYEDAHKLAVSCTQEFPKFQFGWKALGAVLKHTGRISEALTVMQRSVLLSLQDSDAQNNLGNILKELGRLEEAKASYMRAIVLKPDYAEVHSNLGNTLQELKRSDEAEASFRQAIELKSDYAEAHSNLGATLQELRRLDEAEASFNQAIALKPHYAEAHYNLGNTLKELGRLDNAVASYDKAIELKPDSTEANYNLGITLGELGRLEEAEASYKQAIALKPDFSEGHYELGNIRKELGRLKDAETDYKQAILLDPDYAEAHNNSGVTFQELGRLEEAEASYKQAIALKPNFVGAYSNLGNTLQRLGKLKEAEASYKQAIAFNPDLAEAKHMLAALTGKTTAIAPQGYVEGLFDNYAPRFESSLVGNLEYKIPKIIAEMIIEDCKFGSLGSIMDLGCGSGLLGAEVSQFSEYLEGVDLSEKMLAEAKKKNIYNKLIKQDIFSHLQNASLDFDYFISTDVFIYIGDLSNIFRLIKSRNRTVGKLAFSTEDYDGDGFFLEQSGRYSHSKKYIEGLCDKFGFELRHFEIQNLRKEKNQYIRGGVYVLDF